MNTGVTSDSSFSSGTFSRVADGDSSRSSSSRLIAVAVVNIIAICTRNSS